MSKTPDPIVIPKGTREARCSAVECGQPIYWVPTRGGKRMPVSIGGPGCEAPTEDEDGLGISHFADCAAASKFSGRSKRAPSEPFFRGQR